MHENSEREKRACQKKCSVHIFPRYERPVKHISNFWHV